MGYCKSHYLLSLIAKQKWLQDDRNIKEGDVLLIQDGTLAVTGWPITGVVLYIQESMRE